MNRDELHLRALRYLLLAALLVAALFLSACGGGDADDDQDKRDTPTPGVDCVAHPEQCK